VSLSVPAEAARHEARDVDRPEVRPRGKGRGRQGLGRKGLLRQAGSQELQGRRGIGAQCTTGIMAFTKSQPDNVSKRSSVKKLLCFVSITCSKMFYHKSNSLIFSNITCIFSALYIREVGTGDY
jgi:hypothetical protein